MFLFNWTRLFWGDNLRLYQLFIFYHLMEILSLCYPIILTIIRFGFCDIQKNQGWIRGFQPKPKAEAGNLNETFIILDITKTVSNNCFKFIIHWMQKPGSHISSSSLTALAKWIVQSWHDYPQKSCSAVTHDTITCDLECPWHDCYIICSYDVTVTDFENSP